jgi:hypothetical protein
VFQAAKSSETQNRYSDAAQALRREGLQRGTRIAIISDQPFGQGGPFVARLARLQIVVQVNTPSQFWSAASSIQSQVLKAFSEYGAKAVLSWEAKSTADNWKQLGKTGYFVYLFPQHPQESNAKPLQPN